jgi:molybdenum cofactor cytidylyltransferase
VAVPAADHPRALAIADLPATVLALPGSAEGLGGTLREGVAALPEAPAFLLVLADLPGLTAADLRSVTAARDRYPQAMIWRGTDRDGRKGHPILCDTSLRQAFAALHGDDGGRAVMAVHASRTIAVPLADDHATFDLDTPEDWANWRAGTRGKAD